MDYYKIHPNNNKGIAIVVEADGPVSDTSAQRGLVKIIDQTGNIVNEVEMRFVQIEKGDRKGNVVGVAVWDGKNTANRTVGASTYLALVEVEIQYDYPGSKPISGNQRKIIAVTSSGKVLE
jgi:uncharacterized protein (UPF0212 family)